MAAAGTSTASTPVGFDGYVEIAWTVGADGIAPVQQSVWYDTAAGMSQSSLSLQAVSPGAADRSATIPGLLPSTLYYFLVVTYGSGGEENRFGNVVSLTTPPRTLLSSVRGASVTVSNGVQVELRSSGGAAPTITLQASALTGGTTFATIATLPTPTRDVNGKLVAGTGKFDVPGTDLDLDLIADTAGNLYVIGHEAGTFSSILVQRYLRTGSATWTLSGTLKQSISYVTEVPLRFAAAFVPGSGGSPVDSILLLIRRTGTTGSGGLAYAVLDLAAVAASTGTLFLASGNDPAWMPTPAASSNNAASLDAAAFAPGSNRVAIAGAGWAVVDVVNGVVSSVAKDSSATPSNRPRIRVIAVGGGRFAVLSIAAAGHLTATFYSSAGAVLGTNSITATAAYGATFTDQWDAYYNPAAGVLSVYYIVAGNSRGLSRADISTTTYSTVGTAVVSTTFGAVSSTNPKLRVPGGNPDERRIVLTAANLLTGTQSLASIEDRSGNSAPNAPALTTRDSFDAVTTAAVFTWTASDLNPLDTVTAYQLQVVRVSDSVVVVDSGKVASAASTRTLAAATLVNGVSYQWKVRTYDALDTVGAYSTLGSFATSALGTLTITAPAADNQAGIDVSSVPVVWAFAQSDGYVQVSRRLRLIRVSDSAVITDTTLQVTTSQAYTLGVMATDIAYRVELTLHSNGPGADIVANRLVTPSYAVPMTPTLAITAGANYLDVNVVNPTPPGSRPAIVRNDILKRPAGSAAAFVRVGMVGSNGTYRDRAVKSSVAYEYQVKGSTTP